MDTVQKKRKFALCFQFLFYSESKSWQGLSKFLRQGNCVFIQNGLSWLDTLTSLKNVEDGINEEGRQNFFLLHEKMGQG